MRNQRALSRWALMISGRGSTAQSALELLASVDIGLVVSSKKSAYGLKRARRSGIPELVLEKNVDWNFLDLELRRRGINYLFLLGFMKIIPADFVSKWQGRIFNVHPSLLPDFPGAHGMDESYKAAGADMGVTVHEVTPGMDEGPRVLQSFVLGRDEKLSLNWDQVRLRMAIHEQRLISRLFEVGVAV